jgi:flagellar basal-body rod protein FlgF
MSSGLYSAVSGALAKTQTLDILSNNLANVNTTGFKKDRVHFEALLNATNQNHAAKGMNFTRTGQPYVDFSQGSLRETGGTLDLAIDGEGFFKVMGEGGFFYTRQGNLKLDADGDLVTASGWRVMGENGPINLPNPEVAIDKEGKIWAEEGEVGRIALYTFPDDAVPEKRGDGLFTLPAGSRDEVALNSCLLQGRLETSNVNILQEMVQLTEGMRAFEAYQKAIKTYGSLAAKADEIGSVG